MAIFTVIGLNAATAAKLAPAIQATYPNLTFKLSDSVWLVAGSATASEVSNKLGVTGDNQTIDSTVILEVASYFGRANPAVWSWIKGNWGRPTIG